MQIEATRKQDDIKVMTAIAKPQVGLHNSKHCIATILANDHSLQLLEKAKLVKRMRWILSQDLLLPKVVRKTKATQDGNIEATSITLRHW